MSAIYDADPSKIIYIDIETTPATKNFSDLPELLQGLWDKKTASDRTEEVSLSDFYDQRAALYPEFGRIVCISVGILQPSPTGWKMFTKSYCSEDECALLMEFNMFLNKYWLSAPAFCGHNIKEFDMPYIAKRMMINHLRPHSSLDVSGKKPWEISFIDTLELWKCGSYRGGASLELLTAVFGIPTPKDDIHGYEVRGVFYDEGDLDRISTYCQKDVVATAQVLLAMRGEQIIPESNIVFKGR